MRVLGLLLALVIMVPVSAVATIMLAPLWELIEGRLGVEALGHGLPAAWCFIVTYGGFALASSAAVLLLGRSSSPTR